MPPRALLALTRLGQDGHHVLGQAHGGHELFELLQELGARVLLPRCSQTPNVGAGEWGGTRQRAPRWGSGSHGAAMGPPGRARVKPWRCRVGTGHPTAALGWQQRGTKPLGRVTHLPGVAWGGWGSAARLAHCVGGVGFSSNHNQLRAFLVQDFIHPKMHSLGTPGCRHVGSQCGGPQRWRRPRPLPPPVPVPPPPWGAVGARPRARHPLRSCSALWGSSPLRLNSCTMA